MLHVEKHHTAEAYNNNTGLTPQLRFKPRDPPISSCYTPKKKKPPYNNGSKDDNRTTLHLQLPSVLQIHRSPFSPTFSRSRKKRVENLNRRRQEKRLRRSVNHKTPNTHITLEKSLKMRFKEPPNLTSTSDRLLATQFNSVQPAEDIFRELCL